MKWGFRQFDHYTDDEGRYCIETYRFFAVSRGILRKPGLYCMSYDGYPYKILSFGLFSVSWGTCGYWKVLESFGD